MVTGTAQAALAIVGYNTAADFALTCTAADAAQRNAIPTQAALTVDVAAPVVDGDLTLTSCRNGHARGGVGRGGVTTGVLLLECA